MQQIIEHIPCVPCRMTFIWLKTRASSSAWEDGVSRQLLQATAHNVIRGCQPWPVHLDPQAVRHVLVLAWEGRQLVESWLSQIRKTWCEVAERRTKDEGAQCINVIAVGSCSYCKCSTRSLVCRGIVELNRRVEYSAKGLKSVAGLNFENGWVEEDRSDVLFCYGLTFVWW